MKNVLLINAPGTTQGQGNRSQPPLGLYYLAAMFPMEEYKVDVYNGVLLGWEKLLQRIKEYQPFIVGITCLTPNRSKVIKLAKIIKEIDQSIHVVLGGVHPTIMGKQMMENYSFIDFIVRGEGEFVFKELCDVLISGQTDKLDFIEGINYRKNGKVIINKSRPPIKDLDQIPFPRWDLVNVDEYQNIKLPSRVAIANGINIGSISHFEVIFSRGCIGSCSFCSEWWIWAGYRHRSPKNMADELQYLYQTYNARSIIFSDDCFTVDKKAVIELCDLILERNLKIAFKCSTRTDLLDEELVIKLKAAGCYEIAFGVESGDASILKLLNKKNTIDNTTKTFALLEKHGIFSTAMMIVGNIGENYATINNTISLLKKIKPGAIATSSGLLILPGTKSYFYCKNMGYMNDDFWLSDSPYKLFDFEFSSRQLEIFKFAVKKLIYLTPWNRLNYIYIFILRFILRKLRGLQIKINSYKIH